jgi:hypothetical protein
VVEVPVVGLSEAGAADVGLEVGVAAGVEVGALVVTNMGLQELGLDVEFDPPPETVRGGVDETKVGTPVGDTVLIISVVGRPVGDAV